MDTTLTVRLDTQLKDEAERTLDSLGLSMSSAIRVFLTHVVAQKALPFPVQSAPVQAGRLLETQREDPIEYPLHVEVEVLLEQMAAINARLFELEESESASLRRTEIAKVREAVQAMRFQFDPYSKDEVLAMVQQIGQYASALRLSQPH